MFTLWKHVVILSQWSYFIIPVTLAIYGWLSKSFLGFERVSHPFIVADYNWSGKVNFDFLGVIRSLAGTARNSDWVRMETSGPSLSDNLFMPCRYTCYSQEAARQKTIFAKHFE